jgi:hypothetical protein
MLLHAGVFQTVGLMDPDYFVYSDDVDFCWRMLRKRVLLHFTDRFWIYHKESSLTGGAQSPFALRYLTRNRVLFILKNAPWWITPWAMAYLQAEIMKRFIVYGWDWKAYVIQQTAFLEGWSFMMGRQK